MRICFILHSVIALAVVFSYSCISDDSYCCKDNSECVPVKSINTFCTSSDCGQCEAPKSLLNVNVVAEWKDATVGEAYEVALQATGGFGPYQWVAKTNLSPKLTWLVLEVDPNDSSKAYLKNSGPDSLPSTPTDTSETLTIEVTVTDSTKHVEGATSATDKSIYVFTHGIKINDCSHPCTERQTKCDGYNLHQCEAYYLSCTRWKFVKECESKKCITDASGGTCDMCDDSIKCEISGQIKCVAEETANFISVCRNDINSNCSYWSKEQCSGECSYDEINDHYYCVDCPNPSKCEPLSTQCSDDKTSVSTCLPNDHGCWDWKTEDCLGKYSCFDGYCDQVVQISTGEDFSCALLARGRIYCWGRNDYGQIGKYPVGENEFYSIPVQVPLFSSESSVLSAKSISCGYSHACAIGEDDKAYCWGINTSGQLGNGDSGYDQYGDAKYSRTPIPVKDTAGISQLGEVRSISVGTSHSCATIGLQKKIVCWGDNEFGQLGNGQSGSGMYSNIPVAVKDVYGGSEFIGALSVSCGKQHSCIISSDNSIMFCWGRNNYGQLGIDNTNNTNIPTGVKSLDGKSNLVGATHISSGSMHTCAIAGQKAYCWGRNGEGQLGTDQNIDKSTLPILVVNKDSQGNTVDVNYTSLVAGEMHSCGIVEGWKSYCWGFNQEGQLGIGERLNMKKMPVSTIFRDNQGNSIVVNVIAVSGGGRNSCAVIEGGKAYCWGKNYYGEVGNGVNGDDQTFPSPVIGLGP